eukprot:PhF_6_TR31159/c2_g1_i1/m.45659
MCQSDSSGLRSIASIDPNEWFRSQPGWDSITFEHNVYRILVARFLLVQNLRCNPQHLLPLELGLDGYRFVNNTCNVHLLPYTEHRKYYPWVCEGLQRSTTELLQDFKDIVEQPHDFMVYAGHNTSGPLDYMCRFRVRSPSNVEQTLWLVGDAKHTTNVAGVDQNQQVRDVAYQ